jgi:hypothetical protein
VLVSVMCEVHINIERTAREVFDCESRRVGVGCA